MCRYCEKLKLATELVFQGWESVATCSLISLSSLSIWNQTSQGASASKIVLSSSTDLAVVHNTGLKCWLIKLILSYLWFVFELSYKLQVLFSVWYFDFILWIRLLSILGQFFLCFFNTMAVRYRKVITCLFPNTSCKNGLKSGMIVAIAHWGFFCTSHISFRGAFFSSQFESLYEWVKSYLQAVSFIVMTETVLFFCTLHFKLPAFYSFNLLKKKKKRKRSGKVLKRFITRGRSVAIAETGKWKA